MVASGTPSACRSRMRSRSASYIERARGRQGGRPPGLAPRYQKIAPAVNELYEAGQQSTRQLMDYFQIGSRRTLYKILRFAGCQNNEKSTRVTNNLLSGIYV